MSKEMVISASPHETRVAILEDGQLCEIYVEREKEFALVGSIYKGRVTRVLPGMQSAFVEIGLDSDAFLYVSDFLEGIEDVDQVITTVEEKVHKMEEQGGQVFALAAPGEAPAAIEPPEITGGAEIGLLPGEVRAAAASTSLQTPAAQSPQYGAPQQESRDRGRQGGGGFGGRGGRHRGGRDNRSGGRGGGRSGGRGGGRDDQHRHGRELPPSKFASHRPYEAPEPGGVPLEPIILPGESLAKYRDHAPGQPPASIPSETTQASPSLPYAASAQASPAPEPAPYIEPQPVNDEAPSASSASAPVVTPSPEPESRSMGFAHGLEPLPGESIAKARVAPAAAPSEETLAASEQGEEPAHEIARTAFESAPRTMERTQRASEPPSLFRLPEPPPLDRDEAPAAPLAAAPPIAEHAPSSAEETAGEPRGDQQSEEAAHPETELSAEEITSLAEHVAEAQQEEAERDKEDREGEDAQEGAEEDYDAEETEESTLVSGEHAGNGEALEEAVEAAEYEGMPSGDAPASPETSAISAPPTSARVQGDSRARLQHPARRGGRQRDHQRPRHGGGHGRRPQQRRPQLISELLKQGQEIIVQIAKEPLGKKGARITSHVALPGRFLVYMPTLDHIGVSRKIASAEHRAKLRHLVTEAKGGGGGGFIVRTAAEAASPEEIRTDVEFLMHTWNDIKTRAEQRKAPALLHRDLNLVERILRDYLSSDYTAIWVDNEEEFTKVVDFVSRFQPQMVNRVKLYSKDTPVYEEFGIQQEIDKGLRPKVWLKSGGYIVINHTEALVAIDVNTGKYVGRGGTRLEDTIVKTNLEAVKEIVRQIRLRDLGGIIVIDFIDMEERRNRDKVTVALEEALRADRAPSKVLRFNEFGLITITRKRTKQALERTLCQPCPYCTGSGMVKSISTLCYEIQTEVRKMAPEIASDSLTLRVHPEIAKALKTRESALIEELERWTRKSAIIQADPTLQWEQYDIY